MAAADEVFRHPDVIRAELREVDARVETVNARITALIDDRRTLENRSDDLVAELRAQGEDVLTAAELEAIRRIAEEGTGDRP